MLERVEGESFWLCCPGFANELVGREAFEDLQPSGEIVCIDEVVEVLLELRVTVVMVSLDGGFLESFSRWAGYMAIQDSTSASQACGSTSFILAVTMRLYMAAAR